MPTDALYGGLVIKGDWIGLIASLVKIAEVYMLWRFNMGILCWSTAVLGLFVCGTIVLIQKLSQCRKDHRNDRIDVIAEELPTTRKMLCVIVRTNYLWTAKRLGDKYCSSNNWLQQGAATPLARDPHAIT
jgi:hypothetical protein